MARSRWNRSLLPRSRRHLRRRPTRRTPPTDSERATLRRKVKGATLRSCDSRCVYCGTRLDRRTATLDHIQPRAKGGSDGPENLAVACFACNQRKADHTLADFILAYPEAGAHFLRHAHTASRIHKRHARRAVSLAYAALDPAA